ALARPSSTMLPLLPYPPLFRSVALDPAITIPVNTYFDRMLEWVHFSDFVVGMLKGTIFGMVASIVPCTFGLRTRGGTEGIATSTDRQNTRLNSSHQTSSEAGHS